MSIAIEIDESIERGEGNATLIPWFYADPGHFEKSPERSIAEVRHDLQAAGWKSDQIHNQLERDGWKVWFRSQAQLSPPIIQWSKIA